MSGSGRPQHRAKNGSINPFHSYFPSKSKQIRDGKGHTSIKLRNKLSESSIPKDSNEDFIEYETELESSSSENEGNQNVFLLELYRLRKENAQIEKQHEERNDDLRFGSEHSSQKWTEQSISIIASKP
jgi:hypothetical protein